MTNPTTDSSSLYEIVYRVTTYPPTTWYPTAEICNDSFFTFTTDLITDKIWCRNEVCDDVQGKTHCPVTCGTCSTCVDSAGLIFLHPSSTEGHTCAEVVAVMTCDYYDVANTCRASCGTCI